MKTCKKCKIEKELSEFGKRKPGKRNPEKYAINARCNKCLAAEKEKYRKENPEKVSASKKACYQAKKDIYLEKSKEYKSKNKDRYFQTDREYRIKNKEKIANNKLLWRINNPEKYKQGQRSGYEKNREKYLLNARLHYENNKEQHAANCKAWRANNPCKTNAISRARRARIAGADGNHTAADVLRIFEHQRGLCANCHSKLFKSGKQKYHVDHIVPLAKGGSNWPSNLQCLCPTCNLSKHAKDPIAWANEQGRLL